MVVFFREDFADLAGFAFALAFAFGFALAFARGLGFDRVAVRGRGRAGRSGSAPSGIGSRFRGVSPGMPTVSPEVIRSIVNLLFGRGSDSLYHVTDTSQG